MFSLLKYYCIVTLDLVWIFFSLHETRQSLPFFLIHDFLQGRGLSTQRMYEICH